MQADRVVGIFHRLVCRVAPQNCPIRGGLPSRTHDGLHLLLHPDPHRRMEAVSGLPAAAGYIRPMRTYIHTCIHHLTICEYMHVYRMYMCTFF